MASASDYVENQILNFYFNGTNISPPTLWLALFTAAPSDTGGGTEVTGTGYARVNMTALDVFPAASGTGSLVSTAAITGFTAGGTWGTVTHIGIFDAVKVLLQKTLSLKKPTLLH